MNRGTTKYGKHVPELCPLPDVVAVAWIDYLAEDRLLERQYCSTNQWVEINDDYHEVFIYHGCSGYCLTIQPIGE